METVARRRAKPLAILAVAIGVYWLAMFIATHLPFQTTPKGDPYSLDKVQHITAFAVLSALMCTIGAVVGIRSVVVCVVVLGLIVVYASIDEFSQQFVVERTPDFFDWLADMAGAGLGAGAVAAGRIIYVRRQRGVVSPTKPTA